MNFESDLEIVILYSGEFAERVIGNLTNYSTFCVSCADECNHCREDKFNFSSNIKGIFPLPEPSTLPEFIEEGAEEYLPGKIPEADIAIVSEIHNDLLLEVPGLLNKANVKAMIVPIESPSQMAIAQISSICEGYGIEVAFPKPFCDLKPDDDKPYISRFVNEFGIGRPLIDIKLDENKKIEFVEVLRSAPCGGTWFVARKIIGFGDDKRELYNIVSEGHHSYPCTAGMQKDLELQDTILHKAGFITREAVDEAYERASRED